MTPDFEVAIKVIVFISFSLVGLPLLESFISAWLSGWIDVSRKYKACEEPSLAEQIGQPMIAVMPRGISHTLKLQIYCLPSRRGLYLRANSIHRIARSPLLIPWAEVHVGGSNRTSSNPREVALGKEGAMPLKINENFARRIAQWRDEALN